MSETVLIQQPEDFHNLPNEEQQKLWEQWMYHDDYWDPADTLENYMDINSIFLSTERLINWGTGRGYGVDVLLQIDVALAFDKYYHQQMAHPGDIFGFIGHHYWMLKHLIGNSCLLYDSRERYVDPANEHWYSYRDGNTRMRIFCEDFQGFMENSASDYVGDMSSTLQKEEDYYSSEEHLIEQLICNEVEVTYEV